MKCNKCGYNNEPKVIYCVSCGEKIAYTKQKVKEEYQRQIREEKIKKGIELTQTYLIWAVIIFFILLAIRSPFTNYQKIYPFPALKTTFYQKNIPTDTLDISDINK
jgi:uncharacterized membrane protein YvbJ